MNKKEHIQQEKEVKPIEKEATSHDKDAKISELIMDLKRLQAEFENYQKRSEKQNAEYREYSTASIVEQLLPVMDSLEQGIKHNTEFVMVYEQLFAILKKNGVQKIEAKVGDKFDHETMDCLMQESNEKMEEGCVTKVLSVGYKLRGKILRTAKVSLNLIEIKKELAENPQKVFNQEDGEIKSK